jgi:phosphoglycolate phosphatase-like HAD superfamily hydrolase
MSERRLVLFDIDGTLTATNDVDTECYTRAVAEALGLTATDIAWSESPHISDTGIARWLWMQHRGCLPSENELSAVRARLVELLDDQCRQNPDRFRAVTGAADAVERLHADGWVIALATGGWGPSARLKLAAARLPADLPIFCSDDAFERETIVSLARDHCVRAAGGAFDRVVSVGDGVWDVRTAGQLGLPFVGVATGAKAERLKALGASHVIPNLEYTLLSEALIAAQVPRPSTHQ